MRGWVSSVSLLSIHRLLQANGLLFVKMVFTYSLVICAVMAVSLAAPAVVPVAPAAPVLAKLEEFDAAPQYSFAYDVQDSLTGDSKAQYESRNGDVVQGSYSLIEADGTRRIVDYTADPVNGFNAVVSREPAVAVAPVVAKTAVVPAAPAAVVAKTAVVPAVAAPVVAKTVVAPAAVAAAPLVARNVVAPAAPIIAANYAAPAAYAAAPVYARNVLPGAPVAYSLPVPRAVATRLSVPAAYASPYAAYAVGPTYL